MLRSAIRRALDADRLSEELTRAEATIQRLREELDVERNAPRGPHFYEVAKDFDASALYPLITDRVLDDFAPFVNRDALKFLTRGFKTINHNSSSPMLNARVAECAQSGSHRVELKLHAANTVVEVYDFGRRK
jgi:hypothetical protein